MKIILILWVSTFTWLVSANQPIDLAKKVVDLREKSQVLNEEYLQKRKNAELELNSLTVKHTNIVSQLSSEKIRSKTLNAKRKDLIGKIKKSSISSKDIQKVIAHNLEELEGYVSKGLPVHQSKRLAELKELRQSLRAQKRDVYKVGMELWTFMEDEKRLAQETSMFKQEIDVEGKTQLADMIKVGMMYLYFKTESGKTGMAQNINGQWKYVPFSDSDKIEKVNLLALNLKKRVKQGLYVVPTRL